MSVQLIQAHVTQMLSVPTVTVPLVVLANKDLPEMERHVKV